MDETKLTVRIPRDLVENAKRYALQNQTTLTGLIETYLQTLPTHGDLPDAPIVQRLAGILSPVVSIEDYHRHLEDKYGR